jgi:cell division protein FtsL
MFKVLNLINFFPLVSGSNTKRQFVPRLQKTRASFSQKVFFGFFVVLNILLLSNFLYGVNQNASSGYEMKALQNKISVLSEENTKLQMKV